MSACRLIGSDLTGSMKISDKFKLTSYHATLIPPFLVSIQGNFLLCLQNKVERYFSNEVMSPYLHNAQPKCEQSCQIQKIKVRKINVLFRF